MVLQMKRAMQYEAGEWVGCDGSNYENQNNKHTVCLMSLLLWCRWFVGCCWFAHPPGPARRRFGLAS